MPGSKKSIQATEAIREQIRENIQTLHSLLMALAIGNAIRQLAVHHSQSLDEAGLVLLSSVDLSVMVSFTIGLLLIMRCFLGERLAIVGYRTSSPSLFLVDFLNFLFSSVIIAYLSFFVVHPIFFYLIFSILILSDLIWWSLRALLRFGIVRRFEGTTNLSQSDVSSIELSHSLGLAVLVVLGGLSLHYCNGQCSSLMTLVKVLFTESNTGILSIVFASYVLLDVILNGRRYLGLSSLDHRGAV